MHALETLLSSGIILEKRNCSCRVLLSFTRTHKREKLKRLQRKRGKHFEEKTSSRERNQG